MPAANVPLVIDQGEDFTSQLIWTDNYDEPLNVVHPCRLEIRGGGGQVVLSLETDPDIPPGEIPGLNVSSDIGLIQIHISKEQTTALNPGQYVYDLMATHDDGNTYSGLQAVRLLYGAVSVNKSYARV